MKSFRLVVLISGNGSNLQAIINACQLDEQLSDCKVVLVVSNKSSAHGIERARKSNIPILVRPWKKNAVSREEYDYSLGKELLFHKPDLIVLAGWMHVFTSRFIDIFPPQSIINLHPALPDMYPGLNAIERAYEDAKNEIIKETGCMVHTVTPVIDKGVILVTKKVNIDTSQSLSTLESDIHKQEHIAIVEAIRSIVDSQNV